MGLATDQVERCGDVASTNEGYWSRSSIRSLDHRIRDPRSLQRLLGDSHGLVVNPMIDLISTAFACKRKMKPTKSVWPSIRRKTGSIFNKVVFAFAIYRDSPPMWHAAAFAAVPGLESGSRQQSLLLIVADVAVPTVKVLVKEKVHLPTSHAPRFYSKEVRAVSLRGNWYRDPVMFFGVTRIKKLEGFALARTSHRGVERLFVRRVIQWGNQTLKVRRYWHHCAAAPRPRCSNG
jgi:hypothetical protein